ncbi:transmembrane protein 41B isoform X2 [Folsomia candida]|uniref:transmembrane protein 41B isoform X2 n=1 Tax=Folsomia candida TaxID=158441 RepID=UPI000B90092F|nr:transmembrane protein 41B isoform X2 [Folsomia candida]
MMMRKEDNKSLKDLGGLGGTRSATVRPRPATATNGSSNDQTANGGPRSTESIGSSSHSFLFLGLIFVFSLIALFWVYSTFPNLEPDEKQYIKLPRNIDDAKMLGGVLNRYKDKYYMNVLCGVFVVYIFLQTFAIPGSIFLSILSGFLFPFWLALLLVCFCSATGASFCYGLSWLVGRRIIYKYFPERVDQWSATVNSHRDNILNYIIFLRITPFLPNWFINITSPVLGVPLIPFWTGTFIGVAPPSFVAIQAGTTLNQLTSSSDALSWTSLIVLVVLGLLSLIPVLMKDRLKRKFE